MSDLGWVPESWILWSTGGLSTQHHLSLREEMSKAQEVLRSSGHIAWHLKLVQNTELQVSNDGQLWICIKRDMVILMIMSAIVIINMATNVTPGFQELLTILHLSMGLEVSDIVRPQTTACLAELGHLKGTTNCHHHHHHHHHHHQCQIFSNLWWSRPNI